MPTPLRPIRKIGDVRGLTAEEVAQHAKDPEAFGLLCVAEAAGTFAPPAVRQLLESREYAGEWFEELILQRDLHQIAWFRRFHELGAEHPSTLNAHRILSAIRERIPEARRFKVAFTTPRRHKAAQARALNRLKDAHREEVEEMEERLTRESGLASELEITPAARKLLDMPYESFRALVAGDVQNRVQEEGLAHVKVLHRWREALDDLATQTYNEIGVVVNAHVRTSWYPVNDDILKRVPGSEVPARVRQLTFLAHLRARLVERNRILKGFNLRLSEGIYIPIEEHLMSAYYAEYARYRIEEDAAPAADRPLRVPSDFPVFEPLLREHGWAVRRARKQRRQWLIGERTGANGVERVAIIGHLKKNTMITKFLVLTEDGRTYARLPRREALWDVVASPHRFHTGSTRWKFTLLHQTEEIKVLLPPEEDEQSGPVDDNLGDERGHGSEERS